MDQTATKPGTQSPRLASRLATLSLVIGLLVFVQVELLAGWTTTGNTRALSLSAGVRLIIVVGGVGCAIAAMILRKKEGGVAGIRSLLGLVLCLLHGIVAIGFIVLPAIHAPPAPQESWTYHSPEHSLTITLPSRDWREARMQGAVAAFRSKLPSATVGVFVPKGGKEAFQSQIVSFREREQKALGEGTVTTGLTAAGDSYFLAETSEKQADGSSEILIATCFIVREKVDQTLVFICEGQPLMKSTLGKTGERQAIRSSVRAICLSAQ